MPMDNSLLGQGCVDIWIDEIVPCLRDTASGKLLETVVFKIESRKYLQQFKAKDGWHIDWWKIPKNVSVYALALRDTNEIQGIIGLRRDPNAKAVYIHWACVAPHNNKHEFGTQRYIGVGGHLFAIAMDISQKVGYGGLVYGFAANEELLRHYVQAFHAEPICILHPYHFLIDGDHAKELMEVYHYEWNES